LLPDETEEPEDPEEVFVPDELPEFWFPPFELLLPQAARKTDASMTKTNINNHFLLMCNAPYL
jgi:hypothetical protein